MSEMKKKWGVSDFVLERTCPEEHLNLSKKSVLMATSPKILQLELLKGNVLCQMWFKPVGLLSELSQLARFLKEQVRI